MQNIKEYCKEKKQYYRNYIEDHNLNISMAVVWVGNNPASEKYVKNKIRDCESVSIKTELIHFNEDVDPDEFYLELRRLNESNITGYIVQLPLPKQLDEKIVEKIISPSKDIDGFNALSKTEPATPLGIITYLEDQKYDFVNKNCVVIGRSNIVGRPMARLLLDRSANVTVIHSKTDNYTKNYLLRNSDLVICATGWRNTLVNSDFIKDYEFAEDEFSTNLLPIYNDKCFIVDVGINFTDENKLVGDCEKVTVCEKTPVPGGVGLLTRLAVIENLIKLAE